MLLGWDGVGWDMAKLRCTTAVGCPCKPAPVLDVQVVSGCVITNPRGDPQAPRSLAAAAGTYICRGNRRWKMTMSTLTFWSPRQTWQRKGTSKTQGDYHHLLYISVSRRWAARTQAVAPDRSSRYKSPGERLNHPPGHGLLPSVPNPDFSRSHSFQPPK